MSVPGCIVLRVLEERVDPVRGGAEPSPSPPGWAFDGGLRGPDERPAAGDGAGLIRRRAPGPARGGEQGRRPHRPSESGRLPFCEELGLSRDLDHPRLVAFTDERFEQDVLRSPHPVVVDFWAETCVPCRLQEPSLRRLAADLAGKVTFGRLNVFDHPHTPERLLIKGVPHLVVFVGGEVALELVGGHSYEQLKEKLRSIGLV